jgi:hypothetical protein
MSFEPVTMYQFRCDGATTTGQCGNLLMVHYEPDDEDSDIVPATVPSPSIEGYRSSFRYYGWLITRDDRILCPGHIASLEYTARAAVDGLPFDDLLASATPEES